MYVGLDVHKLVCYGTVMTHDGEVVKRTKFTNVPEGLEEFMEGLHVAEGEAFDVDEEQRLVSEAEALLAPSYSCVGVAEASARVVGAAAAPGG